MSDRLRIVLILLLFVFAVFLARQIHKKKVDIRYVLPWFLLILVLGGLVIFPQVVEFITSLVGIVLPINMLFLCGLIFSLTIIYSLTITVSKMNSEIKELSQKIGLLEKKIRETDDGNK